jgi:AcrR family transcriptional regulator
MAYSTAMSNQQNSSTARRTSRQKEAGEATRRETRRLLLAAAKDEFAERGYSAATVARIAERADVAVQTLYSAWGSKRALLRGVMESSVTGDMERPLHPEGELSQSAAGRAPGMTSDELLTFLVHEFRLLAERAAIGWHTYRDAAAVDPAAAEDWRQLMDIRRRAFINIMDRIPKRDFRPGLTREKAVDTAFVIASPDTHEQLVRELGYTYDQFEEWIRTTIIAAILR